MNVAEKKPLLKAFVVKNLSGNSQNNLSTLHFSKGVEIPRCPQTGLGYINEG